MAVFQGARFPTTALPAADAVARPRVGAPATVHSAPRVRPMALLMAAILVSTMLGLVYLTQTLGSNATDFQIGRLEAQKNELVEDLKVQRYRVEQLTDVDAISKAALKERLRRLGDPVVLRAP